MRRWTSGSPGAAGAPGAPGPAGPLIAHVVSTDTTIDAGLSRIVARYAEIAAGVTLEIAADADMEIT